MSSTLSPRLALPLVQAAQAQKHVTVNEALMRLDLAAQLVAEAMDTAAPPVAPADGALWGVAAGATGDWSGRDGTLAAQVNGGWVYLTPAAGWRLYDKATGRVLVHDGSAWQGLAGALDLDHLAGLGIGTTSDATNRLAVASPAALFTHAGDDLRLTLNKATSTDTASLLYQSNWSGRAEMGLTGSDAFAIKVSHDGAAWSTALSIDPATGQPDLAAGASAGGAALHTQDTVLGTVTQSGGVPTGAIVERGANIDGQYVRYADGTQICTEIAYSADGTATASGALWQSPLLSWTFPAPFDTVDSITGTTRRGGYIGGVCVGSTPTGTAADYHFWTSTTLPVGTTIAIYLLAVGRWF